MRILKREPTSVAIFLWEEYLKPLGLMPDIVANRIGISCERMEAILEEDAPIDRNISFALGAYFGVDAEFFFNMDQTYQFYKTQQGVR